MMKKRRLELIFTVIIISYFFSNSVLAHEFILKPNLPQVPPGKHLPFSVISAHVFMISEEMEPIDEVEVSLLKGESREKIRLTQNDTRSTLDGRVKISSEGTNILCGHRRAMVWTKTTNGWKQASKKNLSGVISSGKYEKFCKTLITTGKTDENYKRVVGHKLEIVPVDDPSKAQLDKDLAFQVLFDKAPLATEVYASYDEFSSQPNTYAYFTKTDEKGIAKVKITQPGTWMVRVQHKIDNPTQDYDTYVIRAILIFEVA